METDRNNWNRKKRRNIILIILIAIFMIAAFVGYQQYQKSIRAKKAAEALEATFVKAESLIFDDREYPEAIKLLESIYSENYKDTASLQKFASARYKYSSDDISGAWASLHNIEFRYQSEEHMKEINSFVEEVDLKYQAELEKEQKEWEAALSEKIKNGVPFIGMPESRINDTILGRAASKTDPGTYTTGGITYEAEKYRWYEGTYLIFTAKCALGKVVEVWDHRDSPVNTSTLKDNSGTGSSSDSKDEFDVDAFAHPDDFYEWYYDDFYNFEEAEEYYYEHGGNR